jgi:hypothetical protein
MKKLLFMAVCLFVYGCGESLTTEEGLDSDYTNILIKNSSNEDSVKAYLTLQSPNSVVGMFGIKASDTVGSKSQGYFYAKKDSTYYSNYSGELLGFNISFDTPPMSCTGAIVSGYPNGINIVEGSVNCDYESFDISCVDGVNCEIKTSVTDTINWKVGMGKEIKGFVSAQNKIGIAKNCNIAGVFPYRCTDCIQINPKNIPANCFDLPTDCSGQRNCQVNRADKKGGELLIEYKGK